MHACMCAHARTHTHTNAEAHPAETMLCRTHINTFSAQCSKTKFPYLYVYKT